MGIPTIERLHPIFETVVAFNPKTHEMFDLFAEPEKYQALLKDYADEIRGYSLSRVFLSIRPPYKLTFFKHVAEYLSEEDFAEYLIECYTGCEVTSDTTNVSKQELIDFFTKADKQYLMDKEDLEVFNSLPDKVTIYRGVRDKAGVYELSWTLSLEKARWFANRFSSLGYVFKTVVNKADILCYISCRGEQEVVIDARQLKKYTIEEIA